MPYSYDMLKSLVGDDGKDAAFYDGIFVASFSFAEFLTGVLWGWLSGTIGSKPVLLIGCAGTLVALLVIGFFNKRMDGDFGKVSMWPFECYRRGRSKHGW